MKRYLFILIGSILFCILLSAVVSGDDDFTFAQKYIFENYNISGKEVSVDNEPMNSITIDNGNGTNTVYIFNRDIKYINESGDIVDKDLTLVESKDKNSKSEGYILSVKANNVNSEYPKSLKDVGFRVDNIELKPEGKDVIVSILNESTVSYNNVFDGIDISCSPELNGASYTVVAENIEDLNNVKFIINNFTEYEVTVEKGRIIVQDTKNGIYELAGSELVNEDNEIVGYTTLSLDEKNNIEMTYSLEEASLLTADDSAISTDIFLTKQTYNDSYIESTTVFSDSAFYISESYNYLGTYNDGDEDVVARTFVKFDLSSLANIDYDRILSARYVTYCETDSEYIAEAYFVTDEWPEQIMHWGNMPDCNYAYKIFSRNMKDSYGNFTSNEYDFYITSAVQAWLQGMPNNGIMLKSHNDEGQLSIKTPSKPSGMYGLSVTYSTNSNTPETKGYEGGQYYYLINKNSKMALSANSLQAEANVVQKSFSIAEEQQWNFIHANTEDGVEYYRIKTEPLNYFLKANTTAAYSDTVRLTLTDFSNASLWQIKRNWDGSYKFIPKTSNGTMALSVYDSSMEEEAIVGLNSQTVDFSKEDDWTLIPVEKEKATLYGGYNNGSTIDSREEVLYVMEFLNDCSYSCLSNINETDTGVYASDYIGHLFDSQIWYSSDHGSSSRMLFHRKSGSLVDVTAIGPFTTEEPEDEGEDSSEIIEVSGILDQNEELNSLQLAIMNSCSVGADNNNENLVGLMYELGAHCIVSYTKEVNVPLTEKWYEYFNLALSGADVEFAERFADRMYLNTDTCSRHVLGDTSIFYNYEANAIVDEELLVLDLNNIENSYENRLLSQNINSDNRIITLTNGTVDVLELTSASSESEDINGYRAYFGVNNDLYGYSNFNDTLAFYSMNHRTDKYGRTVVDSDAALDCASAFLRQFRFYSTDYIVSNSNDYSTEFIIKYIPDTSEETVGEGGVTCITVIVENDENNNPVVTFANIERKEVVSY